MAGRRYMTSIPKEHTQGILQTHILLNFSSISLDRPNFPPKQIGLRVPQTLKIYMSEGAGRSEVLQAAQRLTQDKIRSRIPLHSRGLHQLAQTSHPVRSALRLIDTEDLLGSSGWQASGDSGSPKTH